MDVKKAAEISVHYLKELIPDADRINFEEFEILESAPHVHRVAITLSFERTSEEPTVFVTDKLTEVATGVRTAPRRLRYFRIFTIDTDSWEVRGMKQRKNL